MGKFVIQKRRNAEFQFNLHAANGQIVLSSEGYVSKQGCLHGIESVRLHSQNDPSFERRTTSGGEFYFNLKAANGQVIGTSEMYQSAQGRDHGIASVKTNAPSAVVYDLS